MHGSEYPVWGTARTGKQSLTVAHLTQNRTKPVAQCNYTFTKPPPLQHLATIFKNLSLFLAMIEKWVQIDSVKAKTPSELISVAEAGRLLGLSTPTVRKLCNAGKLKRVQLHEKAFRIARRDVEALIAQATVATVATV